MTMFFVHTPELLRIVMTASSATARILAFAVLLLSLAPLGSFYVLFCSITGKMVVENVGNKQAGDEYDHGGGGAAVLISMDTMAHVLNDPNVTLEEIWNAILSSSSSSQYPPWQGSTAAFAAVFPLSEAAARHLTILLPWLISLLFGIVLPAVVSIVSFLWGHRMRQQQRQYDADAAMTQERRRVRLEKKLKYFTKTLNRGDEVVFCYDDGPKLLQEQEQEDDATTIPKLHDVSTSSEETFLEETEECSISDETTDDTILSQFRLPKPGIALPVGDSTSSFSGIAKTMKQRPAQGSSDYRAVAETCAICLHPYKPGDAVTWSPNANCIHCFHEQCIVTWLIRKPSKQQACPCCRQNFIRPQFTHASMGSGSVRHGMMGRHFPY